LRLFIGARGSLSERVIKNFELRKNSEVQLYGLGVKEVIVMFKLRFGKLSQKNLNQGWFSIL
jgi:hypothetical protein